MSEVHDAAVATDATKTLVAGSLQMLSEEIEAASRIFPHGINSIRVRLAVANVGEAELEIQGPASASSMMRSSADNELLVAPAITGLSQDEWVRGEAGTMTIFGTGFSSPSRVRIPAVNTRRPRWDPEKTNEIVVDIEVDDFGGASAREVEILFDNMKTAKRAALFKVRDSSAE